VYLSLLWKHKFILAAVFLITTAAIFVGSGLLPARYEADASLLVRQGREFAYRPEVGSSSSSMLALDEIVNSEVAILGSRELARQTVEEIGALTMYPDLAESDDPATIPDAAVAIFRDHLTVRGVDESSIIRLRFEHSEPRIASEALNLLLSHFESKHLEIFRDPRSEFLEEQLTTFQGGLRTAENSLEAFRQEFGVFDLAEQKRLLLVRRSDLEPIRRAEAVRRGQLTEVMRQLGVEASEDIIPLPADRVELLRSEILSRRDLLSTTLRKTDLEIGLLQRAEQFARATAESAPQDQAALLEESRTIESARLMRLELELEEHGLLDNYLASSQAVQSVRARIALIDEFLGERARGEHTGEQARLSAEREAYEDQRQWLLTDMDAVEVELLALEQRAVLGEVQWVEDRIQSLDEEAELLDQEIRRLDLREQELQRLQRAVGIFEARVQNYSQRYDEARISEELVTRRHMNVRIIERASMPTQALALSTKMRVVLSAGAGFSAVLAVALLLGMMSSPAGRAEIV
jgi:uncharacterized protein involved in exopolysaccharide biosynthesis